MDAKTKSCPACHGTGQWTYFGGVSRFFLTVEECPECGGMGVLPVEPEAEKATAKAKGKKGKGGSQ